jgi:hypothetical protein
MPASAPITLLSATGIAASSAGAAVAGFSRYAGVLLGLNLTAKTTGGAGTLDVYVQATPDGGTTWQDVAAFRFTTTLGWRYVGLSQVAAGPTTTQAASDGALTSDAVVPGPFGDQLRVKYVMALNGDTGTFGLTATATPVAGV